MFKRQADKEPATLPHTVVQEQRASRELVDRVLRAQRLQEAVVRAAIQQLTVYSGQEALQT